MKTIIAGSRSIKSYATVWAAVQESGFAITEVVSGCASGVDVLGEKWAGNNNIPVKRFQAAWRKHGRAAGPIRNRQMAAYADALIAVWDGKSAGTKNMIDEAKSKGLRVFIYNTGYFGEDDPVQSEPEKTA